MSISSKACALVAAGTAGLCAASAETSVAMTDQMPDYLASAEGRGRLPACVKDLSARQIDFRNFHDRQILNLFESLAARNTDVIGEAHIVLAAQLDKRPLTGLSMLPGDGPSLIEVGNGIRVAANGEGLDTTGRVS